MSVDLIYNAFSVCEFVFGTEFLEVFLCYGELFEGLIILL